MIKEVVSFSLRATIAMWGEKDAKRLYAGKAQYVNMGACYPA